MNAPKSREPRLSWDPVREHLARRIESRRETPSLQSMSDLIDVHVSSFCLYQREGVTLRIADRIATRMGMHPVDLWPDWYSIEIDENLTLTPEERKAERYRQRDARKKEQRRLART